MKFSSDEIASVLQQEIEQFDSKIDVREVGTVLEVGDGIARVYGLSNALAGEQLQFENGEYGQVFNLEESSVGVVIFGDDRGIKEGDTVKRTGGIVSVPVGDQLLGRVVDPLGNAVVIAPLGMRLSGPAGIEVGQLPDDLLFTAIGQNPQYRPASAGTDAREAG